MNRRFQRSQNWIISLTFIMPYGRAQRLGGLGSGFFAKTIKKSLEIWDDVLQFWKVANHFHHVITTFESKAHHVITTLYLARARARARARRRSEPRPSWAGGRGSSPPRIRDLLEARARARRVVVHASSCWFVSLLPSRLPSELHILKKDARAPPLTSSSSSSSSSSS